MTAHYFRGGDTVQPVERKSFEEHDRRMAAFRQAHPGLRQFKGVATGESILLQNPEIIANNGGVNRSADAAEWRSLIPVCGILESRFWSN